MPVSGTEHLATRPSWNCSVCNRPWPCENSRTDLIAEYATSRVSLMMYLALMFTEAADDLARPDGKLPNDLYERFVLWAR